MSRVQTQMVEAAEWNNAAISQPSPSECGADLDELDGMTIHGTPIDVQRLVTDVRVALEHEFTQEDDVTVTGSGRPVERSRVITVAVEAVSCAVAERWGGANRRGVDRFAAFYSPDQVATEISEHLGSGGVYPERAGLEAVARVAVAYALGQLNAWSTDAQAAVEQQAERDLTVSREEAGW